MKPSLVPWVPRDQGFCDPDCKETLSKWQENWLKGIRIVINDVGLIC